MKRPTRCLTGSEPTTRELAGRLDRPGELHEVRLDLLTDLGGDTYRLLQRHGPRLVVTCRAGVEGGGFEGTEGERLAVLRKAARTGAAWLDLELFLFEQGATARLDLDRLGEPPRLIASLHDFEGGAGRAEQLASRFEGCPADLAKLAVAVDGPEALADLRRLDLHNARRVVIGMGEAGVWSRMRPADFGSEWTYLAADEDRATAPGQLSVDRADSLRLADHERLAPLALLGGPGIRRSPGPQVYNALLTDLDLPFQYLPLPARTAPSRTVLADLGVGGVSVAAPFKADLMRVCQELDPWASRSGVINTILRLDDGRWAGWNTDAPAVLELLGDAVQPGARALILGTGATARSVATALAGAGVEVTQASRRGRRASQPTHRSWEEAADVEARILVNCTPPPWPGIERLRASTVLDMVLDPGGATPLVTLARGQGCRTYTGQQLWCHQGALQMSLLLGRPITAEMLATRLAVAGWEI